MLLCSGEPTAYTCSFSWLSNHSMWPLLRRDGLALQYTVMALFYAWLMGTFRNLPTSLFAKIIHLASYTAIIAIHSAESIVGKIGKYPDLWVVGNVLVCFGCYVIAWAWLLKRLWTESLSGKSKIE
jgi:alpha-1,3-glucosyltransferase